MNVNSNDSTRGTILTEDSSLCLLPWPEDMAFLNTRLNTNCQTNGKNCDLLSENPGKTATGTKFSCHSRYAIIRAESKSSFPKVPEVPRLTILEDL